MATKQDSGFLKALFGRLLFWAPVWIPLIVVYQLVLGGMKPTLADGERIQGADSEVRERVEKLEAERDELETRREMLGDPIYRARVERSRLRADREPLTLDNARAAEPAVLESREDGGRRR